MNGNDISKLISYWLRHHPEDGGLVIDEFGWTNTTDLLYALRTKGYEIKIEELFEMSNSFDKVRWEFNLEKDRIRATHGHSINVVIDKDIAIPPDVLYHGTAIRFLEDIIAGGLKSMSRQFVHLSAEADEALKVGQRHGKSILIEVDSQSMYKNGHIFYNTSDNVWLTKDIPNSYLSFGPWRTMDGEEGVLLKKELNREVGPNHQLNNRLKTLKAFMKRDDQDDCLFIDSSDNTVHDVHLTWNPQDYYSNNYPRSKSHMSLGAWLNSDFMEDYNFQ